jgi:multidrug efflux pump subunit AcrB
VQAVVDGYPGLTRDLLTFLRERIKEVLTGASASVVVRIFGPDLDMLRTHAAEVSAAVKDIPGISALKVESLSLVPQITVKVKPEAAALHGLTAGQIRQAVTTLISGRKVGEVYQEQRVHDVTVWSVPSARADYTTLRDLLIETPSGGHVRLADVADSPSCPRRTRSNAKVPPAASTSPATSQAAPSAMSPRDRSRHRQAHLQARLPSRNPRRMGRTPVRAEPPRLALARFSSQASSFCSSLTFKACA